MLQLEAEERVGFVARYGAALARAREDAMFEAVKAKVGA